MAVAETLAGKPRAARRARTRNAALFSAAFVAGASLAGGARAQPATQAPSQATEAPSQSTGVTATGSTSAPSTYLITGIRVAATYSDNLNLARSSGAQQDGYVMEVSPYALWQTSTDRLRTSGTVAIRNFVRSVGESSAGRLEGVASGVARLAGDWAWLEVTGRATTISGGSGVGTLAYNTAFYLPPSVAARTFQQFSVSPFIRDRAGWLDYQLRYRYVTNNSPFPRTVQEVHQFSGNASTGSRFGRWNYSLVGLQTRNVLGDGRSFDRRILTASAGYLVNPELRVGATVNYEQIDFLRGPNGRDYGVGPGVFFDWRPNSRFNVGASWSERFYGRNVSAQMGYRNRNLGLSLSYIDAVLTSADASALFFDPASVGSTSSGGVPFGAPILGNRVIQDLIQQQLLLFGVAPFDLAFNTAALARTQRLTLSGSLAGKSNTLSMSVFHSTRDVEADISQGVSSGAGTINLRTGLEGKLTQTGTFASLTHRLDSRSTVGLTGRYTIVETEGNFSGFLNTGRTTLSQVALNYGFRVTQDVTAGFVLRRTQQRFDGSIGSQYTENAVSGVVDVRF